MWLRVLRTVLYAVAVLSLPSSLPRAQAPTRPSPEPPLSFEQVKGLAISSAISTERFAKIVDERGLAVPVTTQLLQELRAAGATSAKLDILRGAPKPNSKREDGALATGSLKITCSPPECDIEIDGVKQGATTEGTKIIPGLAPAEVSVKLSKGDPPYLGKQRSAQIEAGKMSEIKEELLPSAETKRQFGRGAFDRVVLVLGGPEALATARNFRAQGELNVFDAAGARTSYEVRIKAILPVLLHADVSGAPGKKGALRLDPSSIVGGTAMKGTIPPLVEKCMRLYAEDQPTEIIGHIAAAKLAVMADEPKPTRLVASSTVETIPIEIDPETLLPTSIRRERNGVGTPEQVNWNDFRPLGKTQYPRDWLIKFSPESKEGCQVRFISVELGAELTEKDFK